MECQNDRWCDTSTNMPPTKLIQLQFFTGWVTNAHKHPEISAKAKGKVVYKFCVPSLHLCHHFGWVSFVHRKTRRKSNVETWKNEIYLCENVAEENRASERISKTHGDADFIRAVCIVSFNGNKRLSWLRRTTTDDTHTHTQHTLINRIENSRCRVFKKFHPTKA